MTGSGVAARVAIEHATVSDPTHRMTQLVGLMLQGDCPRRCGSRRTRRPERSCTPICWTGSNARNIDQ